MKKMTKILCRVLPVVLVGLLVVSNVFGVGAPTQSDLGNQAANTQVAGLAQKIWGTVALIVRIIAIAAVVFAGVRYMTASANDKADIKQQMIILVLGAVLVFGATFLLQIVSDLTTDTLSQTNGN